MAETLAFPCPHFDDPEAPIDAVPARYYIPRHVRRAFLRCPSCGWCHVLADPGNAAGERCYRCDSPALSVIDRTEFGRTVPPGVTLLPRTHPDIERHPDRCSGAWCVTGTRVMVQGILDNAADFTAEEIATEIYKLPVDGVRRILGSVA